MMSSANAMSSSNAASSLYIPSVKLSYSVEKIVFLFWKHGLGKVDRVDFVPIIRANDKECANFKQAFLYVDPRSSWHPDIVKSIEGGIPYRVYPNREETFDHLRDEKEYWLILKNKSPVPYATTTLNVHQLANNLALLEEQLAEREARLVEKEARLVEREEQITELESELAVKSALVTELQAVNNRLSDFNRVKDDNDENTEEMKAYNFVTSLDNVLHMMKKAHNEYNGYIESEEVDYEEEDHYEEFSLSDRFNNDEDEDDLDKDECCGYCQMSKKIVLYNWRSEDDGLCEDCANLLTKNDEA